MFYIDNKSLKITKQEVHIGKFTNNGNEGYNVCIKLKFINDDNINGYLNLDAGFGKNNGISFFSNREYKGIPFDNDNQFIYFEVFDTEKFLDTEIESEIIIKFGGIKDNKVKAFFELNDELIKIKYDGYLDIINIL